MLISNGKRSMYQREYDDHAQTYGRENFTIPFHCEVVLRVNYDKPDQTRPHIYIDCLTFTINIYCHNRNVSLLQLNPFKI